MIVKFFVPGKAEPAGSKRALPFGGKAGARPIVVDANKNAAPWKATVRAYALQNRVEGWPLLGPVKLTLRFVMRRPKGHYRTGKHAGELKPGAPLWHTSKPDRLKLARAIEDSFSGVIWKDDAQTAEGDTLKMYGETEGVWIEVEELR